MQTFNKEFSRDLIEWFENENVNVSGNDNGGYKNDANLKQNWYKSPLIKSLYSCRSNTAPIEIAKLLKEIFACWPSDDGHWLWIAQRYNPRVINWVMSSTVKMHLRGAIMKTPPAYFTFVIKRRKPKKEIRATNGGR